MYTLDEEDVVCPDTTPEVDLVDEEELRDEDEVENSLRGEDRYRSSGYDIENKLTMENIRVAIVKSDSEIGVGT